VTRRRIRHEKTYLTCFEILRRRSVRATCQPSEVGRVRCLDEDSNRKRNRHQRTIAINEIPQKRKCTGVNRRDSRENMFHNVQENIGTRQTTTPRQRWRERLTLIPCCQLHRMKRNFAILRNPMKSVRLQSISFDFYKAAEFSRYLCHTNLYLNLHYSIIRI